MHNPTRRNRNIGSERQGHGKDNKLVIPWPFHEDRIYYEILPDAREYSFELHGDKRVALVQPPTNGNYYGCTLPDLIRILRSLPAADVDGLDLFLFRQPTKKQLLLKSVWGRFIYYATPSRHRGSAICIEATKPMQVKWPKSNTPEHERELARLAADGCKMTYTKREILIDTTRESLRNTVLYRTVLHETGHYVDWLRSVLDLEGTETEIEAASERFDTKTSAMKEDFAHRYAKEMADKLRANGQLPFPITWDEDAMQRAGIQRSWFVPDAS
ncbi:MAG: hypothetical protein AB8H80_08120 [Planctomycetota bacterium]